MFVRGKASTTAPAVTGGRSIRTYVYIYIYGVCVYLCMYVFMYVKR